MADSMQVEEAAPTSEAAPVAPKAVTRKAKTATIEVAQLPGTTAFPISKVSKIIKADKDVQMCQREAVFLISCATVRAIATCGFQTHVDRACIAGALPKEDHGRSLHTRTYGEASQIRFV